MSYLLLVAVDPNGDGQICQFKFSAVLTWLTSREVLDC